MNNNILEVSNLSKKFSGVHALKSVDFSLNKGEVHALLGENGAGKSTLIKILTGAIAKDSGTIKYIGENLENLSPSISRKMGINAIYQELTLVKELPVYQNLFLGHEYKRLLTHDKLMIKEAQRLMNQLEIATDVRTPVKNLTIALQQMIEIARALLFDTKILIMDEPTSSLSKKETEILFKKIKELTEKEVSVIYISHRIEEIFQICDRVTIMRDGSIITTYNVKDVESEEQLVNAMIGNKLDNIFPNRIPKIGNEILRIDNFERAGVFENVSFNIHQGEIFGIGGLVGSKRSEIVETLFGLQENTSGTIYIDNKPVKIKNPKSAIEHGFALLTENRKETGLFLQLTVRENITMPILRQLTQNYFVNRLKEKKEVEHYIDILKIKTPSFNQIMKNLSGGNQQKSLIARWILSQPRVLIIDEPTRGIDVNAKSEIYRLMDELTQNGVGIIMISSELPELIAMSDRILVMHEGKVSGMLESKEEITESNVLRLAFGGNIE